MISGGQGDGRHCNTRPEYRYNTAVYCMVREWDGCVTVATVCATVCCHSVCHSVCVCRVMLCVPQCVCVVVGGCDRWDTRGILPYPPRSIQSSVLELVPAPSPATATQLILSAVKYVSIQCVHNDLTKFLSVPLQYSYHWPSLTPSINSFLL
jgi:hypothetical protein